MKFAVMILLFVMFVAFDPLAATAASDAPCLDRLFEFEVEDQFKDDRTAADLLGRVSVVVWADRDAREFTDSWREAIESGLGDAIAAGDVQVRAWAHTKGAPFFVKGRVRGSFSEDRERWAFLDWDGLFRERYEPTDGEVNVFLFDRDGCLVERTTGKNAGVEEEARQIVERVEALIAGESAVEKR